MLKLRACNWFRRGAFSQYATRGEKGGDGDIETVCYLWEKEKNETKYSPAGSSLLNKIKQEKAFTLN